MRKHIAGVENAGVGNAEATKYGKPSEENTLKYQTKYGCRGFHSQFLLNATHKRVGLLTLLLNIDSVSDVSRVTRGLAIRRAKKRVNLTNDKRIKMCLQRFDNHAYARLQFLHAVSHVGSEKMLSESHSDADDDDDTEAPDDNRQHQNDDHTMTTPVRQRSYQLTQLLTSARCVSWHRVIHALR